MRSRRRTQRNESPGFPVGSLYSSSGVDLVRRGVRGQEIVCGASRCRGAESPPMGPIWSRGAGSFDSLFISINSLFTRNNSLFEPVGNSFLTTWND